MEEKNNNFENEVATTSVEEVVEETPVKASAPASVEKVEKPKKKKNVPAILLGILALILAGVATFFGLDYFGIIGEEKIKEVVTIEKVPEEVIVEITTSTMADEYKEVSEMIEMLTDGMENYWDYVSNGSGLTYKPEGLNSYVPMKINLNIKINNANNGATNLGVLKSRLENAGFKSIGVLPHLGSAGPVIDGYYNTDKDIVCGVFANTEWRSENLSYEYVDLSCAKSSWAWLTESDKALINGLGRAFFDKTGEYPRVLSIGNKVEDSQYEPYQTLTVGVGGAAGLFYRVNPEAEWQFFAATQAILSCSEYNTDDLKKAYLGDICWDETNMIDSKVEL